MKRAVQLNGVGALALMKLDVLTGLAEIPNCVANDASAAAVYERLSGWQQDLRNGRTREGPAVACRAYVDCLEQLAGAPIDLIAVGPDRIEAIGPKMMKRRLQLY